MIKIKKIPYYETGSYNACLDYSSYNYELRELKTKLLITISFLLLKYHLYINIYRFLN